MKSAGNLIEFHRDFETGLTDMTIRSDAALEDVEKFKGKKIKVNITNYFKDRSTDANSYYWVLIGKLAAVMHISNDELHEIMLRRYGSPYIDYLGNTVLIMVRDDVPESMLPGHWRPVGTVGNAMDFTKYIRLLGSSEMDQRQFSRLLDGLITECKEQEIDTITPNELLRLKGYTL